MDVSDAIGKTLKTLSCEAKSLGMSADYDFVFPELFFIVRHYKASELLNSSPVNHIFTY